MNHKGSKRPEKKRFTLIELMVTISIILVLVAILMPTLERANRVALRAACISHFRQLYLTQVEWMKDFDGHATPSQGNLAYYGGSNGDGNSVVTNFRHPSQMRFLPAKWYAPGAVADDTVWMGNSLLHHWSYIDEFEIAWCPANDSPGIGYHHPSHGWRGGKPFRLSSPSNGAYWMASEYQLRSTHDPIIGRRRAPMLTVDSSDLSFMSDMFTVTTYYSPLGFIKDSQHKDGFNVVYLDGSASFVPDYSNKISNTIIARSVGNGNHDRIEKVFVDFFDRR